MKVISEKRIGYATTTYKLKLYNRHHNWLVNTKQLYNQVVWHYYRILINETQRLEQSNFLLVRELEVVSIGTKEMKEKGEEPIWKLPNMPKIPLYFRRAAIHTAIGLARGYVTSCKEWERRAEQRVVSIRLPSQAAGIDCSPVFYKGMYRNFCESSIELKVFNGEKWVWITYPYSGRQLPKEARILSPTLKIEKKALYLHVPVQIEVTDIRTVKERMEKEERICAVAFPDYDVLAVCAIMNKNGDIEGSYFIRGGNMREMQRREVLAQIEKSHISRQRKKLEISESENELRKIENLEGGSGKPDNLNIKKEIKKQRMENKREAQSKENARLYKKLEQINQYYAHKISREILNYCERNQIKVIVVPNYDRAIPFEKYSYLKSNLFHWQGRSIIRNLKYKAFQQGILVTSIYPYHISDCCSECGGRIQYYNEGHKASRNYYGGKLFFCSKGHRGNVAFNTARNIGRYFLTHFQKEVL